MFNARRIASKVQDQLSDRSSAAAYANPVHLVLQSYKIRQKSRSQEEIYIDAGRHD